MLYFAGFNFLLIYNFQNEKFKLKYINCFTSDLYITPCMFVAFGDTIAIHSSLPTVFRRTKQCLMSMKAEGQ